MPKTQVESVILEIPPDSLMVAMPLNHLAVSDGDNPFLIV